MSYPRPQDKLALYDRYAVEYEARTKNFGRFLAVDFQLFLENLPGPSILDMGAGPGRDSQEFKRRGYRPVALDLSTVMLGLCRQKGLATIQMDIEKLNLPPASFDGVWSYTSLTTIPKLKVWRTIGQLYHVLKPGGCLYLGLIEGEGDGWKPADQKYAIKRYISRYQFDEVVQRLSPQFELLYFRKITHALSGRNTYLNFLLRRLES